MKMEVNILSMYNTHTEILRREKTETNSAPELAYTKVKTR